MGSSNSGAKEDSGTDADETNGGPSATDSGVFSEGEKVLAYHGPRIYEAKGWNKNWDEWVGIDRLMKFTEENVRTQQALNKKQDADKNPKSSSPGITYQGCDSEKNEEVIKVFSGLIAVADSRAEKIKHVFQVARGKKRMSDSGVEEKDTVSVEKLAKIQIPSTLKKQLVDDWEFVTQLGKLVKLPRSPSVDDILKKYLDYKSKKDGMIAESIGEILKGLRCYFDKALPVMLLYKRERQQYNKVVVDNISPSTIYGAEHLLRLFVKLPELLAYANIEEETLTRLQQKLLDFLKQASWGIDKSTAVQEDLEGTSSSGCSGVHLDDGAGHFFTVDHLRNRGFCRRIRVPSSFLLMMVPKVLKEVVRNKMIEQQHDALNHVYILPSNNRCSVSNQSEVRQEQERYAHLLYIVLT
ncbi:hypothetical protein HHK36_030980 [Tetracentron sinense]|uniref:MRG domain-containing protein n=1 Tax=Tetracentron sinense TaxID=13715 RepID=A0A834YA83_TETSI|nr:hypothetical protein HHK36_030980 [Tetracentron sinense]